MALPNLSIILVEPQMGANIGAVARVMLNFGFTDLRLVQPRDGWPNTEADRNSAGALEIMPEVQVFETLQSAVADLNYLYATTARPRDMFKPVCTPQDVADNIQTDHQSQNVGIVFGGERAGLTNDHIALCQSIVTIPTNPDFSSLNLAQSVLLLVWEIFKGQGADLPSIDDKNMPVEQAQLEEFFTRLESELEEAQFFKAPDLKPQMVRNIRNMFVRKDLTDQEVRTLHGIVSALIGKKRGL